VFKLVNGIFACILCGGVFAAELTDPTRPAGYQEFQPSPIAGQEALAGDYLPLKEDLDPNQFKLHGIITAKSGNSAMVNGRRMRIGDEIYGVMVTEIEPTYIVLEGAGNRLTLELLSLRVKQSAHRSAGENQ